MIDSVQHPLLVFTVAILGLPVYRGLALALFGTKERFQAAIRHCVTPGTWLPFKDPLTEDWETGVRMFSFVALCASFIAATCHFFVRFMI
jgi:hypothetical protein